MYPRFVVSTVSTSSSANTSYGICNIHVHIYIAFNIESLYTIRSSELCHDGLPQAHLLPCLCHHCFPPSYHHTTHRLKTLTQYTIIFMMFSHGNRPSLSHNNTHFLLMNEWMNEYWVEWMAIRDRNMCITSRKATYRLLIALLSQRAAQYCYRFIISI